jgi:Kef-type K+ transport system membrane component KefB
MSGRTSYSFHSHVLIVLILSKFCLSSMTNHVTSIQLLNNSRPEALATCEDSVTNGAETDVDCGGDQCPECDNGKLCATGSDCVSSICEAQSILPQMRCKRKEIDTQAAMHIALRIPENSNLQNESSEVEVQTKGDELVEAEKTVRNATVEIEKVQKRISDLLVKSKQNENITIERDKMLNATLDQLDDSVKTDERGQSDASAIVSAGDYSETKRTIADNVKLTKKVVQEMAKTFVIERQNDEDVLKEMQGKIESLAGKINRTKSELKYIRKHSSEKAEALKTLGREKMKDDAVKQIEEQIESGAKVDYESGDLENKDGKRIDDLEKKIQHLDSNTRLRVEKARQTAIEKAEDPAIMKTDLTLLLDVTIMLSFAAFGGFTMKILGLPIAFGYIIGGLVVGPSTLSFVSNIAQVQTLAQFGSMFMIFGLGVEFPVEQVIRVRKIAVQGGLVSIFVVAGAFAVIIAILSANETGNTMSCVLMGCGLAMSSTTIVLNHVRSLKPDLEGRRLHSLDASRSENAALAYRVSADSLHGQISLGIIAMHEFWMALILSLPDLLHSDSMLFSFSRVCFGMAIAYIMVRLTPLSHINRMLHFVSKQEETMDLFKLGIVSFCLIFSLITYSCGLSLELGAFISGYLLSRSPHRLGALRVVEPLKSLFSIIFFASMGMTLNMRFLFANAWFLAYSSLVFIIIKSVVIASVLICAYGVPIVTALTTGLILGSIGELSLVFISKAASMSWKNSTVRMIGRRHYLLYLATTVVVLLVSPLVHKLLPHQWIALVETKMSTDFLKATETFGSSGGGGEVELHVRKERHSDNEEESRG